MQKDGMLRTEMKTNKQTNRLTEHGTAETVTNQWENEKEKKGMELNYYLIFSDQSTGKLISGRNQSHQLISKSRLTRN